MALDPNLVAQHLGLDSVDGRLILCTAAAGTWVEKRRSLTPPAILWTEHDVIMGAAIYANLIYQQRSSPQGIAGYDTMGNFGEDTGLAMANVYRLVGQDPVIA